MRNSMKQVTSFGYLMMGGIVAGIVSAILANVAAVIIEWASGLHFAELTPLTITLASLIPNILGAVVYCLIARRARRPQWVFGILALVLASLDTITVTVNPPQEGFGTIADVLHYMVALVSIITIPRFAKHRTADNKDNVAA